MFYKDPTAMGQEKRSEKGAVVANTRQVVYFYALHHSSFQGRCGMNSSVEKE